MMALRRDASAVPAWAAAAAGELRRDEPMARHTTWRAGGPADWFYEPADLAALAAFLRAVPAELPVTFVGLGSNLLVRDGGIRGVVVRPRTALQAFAMRSPTSLHVGAGIACARIARHCARHGLGPAAFFAGIPGTLGGALAMNAGAWGGETWSRVEAVEVIGRDGELRRRTPDDYVIGYRSVAGRHHDAGAEWFVAADLGFRAMQDDSIAALLLRRKQTQPLGEPSCGSVFRNPPGDHAARLIEACGLKGVTIGGARVSPKHANFIVNTGRASAADIERLIGHVQDVVARATGVRLVPEVRIVGEQP